jgi:hypothetical protein
MEIIALRERDVKARGLSKELINPEKVRKLFFEEDYLNLNLLNGLKKIDCKESPILLYPGCGSDVLFPLHYMEKLFNIKEVSFLFVDSVDNFGLIKTVLDEAGISFAEEGKKLHFYWGDLLVLLQFQQGDIFTLLPNLPRFNIYFEKAFRIMKSEDHFYEERIFHKLINKGVVISDSGFRQFNLRKLEVSSELSSYGEMIIGVKD